MPGFIATFAPHGENTDGYVAATWTIEAKDRQTAMRQAMDLAGKAIGESDFAYRELADGSLSILEAVYGWGKIASLRLRAARRSDLAKAA